MINKRDQRINHREDASHVGSGAGNTHSPSRYAKSCCWICEFEGLQCCKVGSRLRVLKLERGDVGSPKRITLFSRSGCQLSGLKVQVERRSFLTQQMCGETCQVQSA